MPKDGWHRSLLINKINKTKKYKLSYQKLGERKGKGKGISKERLWKKYTLLLCHCNFLYESNFGNNNANGNEAKNNTNTK